MFIKSRHSSDHNHKTWPLTWTRCPYDKFSRHLFCTGASHFSSVSLSGLSSHYVTKNYKSSTKSRKQSPCAHGLVWIGTWAYLDLHVKPQNEHMPTLGWFILFCVGLSLKIHFCTKGTIRGVGVFQKVGEGQATELKRKVCLWRGTGKVRNVGVSFRKWLESWEILPKPTRKK